MQLILKNKSLLLPLLAVLLMIILGGAALGLKIHHTNTSKMSPDRDTAGEASQVKQANNNDISNGSEAAPSSSSNPTSNALTQNKPAGNTTITTKNKSAQQSNTPATSAPIPSPTNCVKDTSYKAAGPLGISTSSPGYTKVIDPPSYYTVYGYTADQIRTQINQCFPGAANSMGDVDAASTFSINFTYNIYTKPSGLCALKDLSVGLHVNILYPKWTNTTYAAAGLNGQWQTYIANLTTHENGHKDIAVNYATTIYNNLQNYPDTNCATIDQSAKNFANNLIGIMYLSQATYDSQNKHGATQGAVFP